MKFNHDMAIVIVTCDSYIDVIHEYLRYFNMNWKDCPFELIIVGETIDVNDKQARCILTCKGMEWAKRAIVGIESTTCPYILLSMDDGYISKKVNNLNILDILSFMKTKSIKYYRNPKRTYEFKNNPTFPERENTYKIRKNEVYGIDFGHNIWERNTIRKLLGDGTKNAWQIEEYLNEVALNSNPGYYDDFVSDKTNFLHIIETVSGGKWMPTEIKKLEKLGIPVNLGNRDILPISDTIRRKIHHIACKIVPQRNRKAVKKFFTKLGYKFVTKN